jgi:uncharacterized protein YaiI (UPF0178 family)
MDYSPSEPRDILRIQLYVDADACQRNLRAIIIKAIVKRRVPAFFAADRSLPDVTAVIQEGHALSDGYPLVHMAIVPKGDDSADDCLVKHAHPGALAITRDIILAARLAELGLVVLDDRGGVYTKENVRERLSVRNMMTELRDYGIFAERTRPMGPREIQAFSNALDREITRLMKNNPEF